MKLGIGLKITLRDPDDPAGVIHAQFASARACPDLIRRLQDIADRDVAENVALRRLALASDRLADAADEEAVAAACEALAQARRQADAACVALVAAVGDFLVAGFMAAGSDRDHAEELAAIVPVARVAELRGMCLFGSGCLDFTEAGAPT